MTEKTDAKAGLFDFIITKEIFRFFCYTLDSIKHTQKLLEHNVGVYFQTESIAYWVLGGVFCRKTDGQGGIG